MATTRVQLPDGGVGEFPATMKPEEIQSVLAKQFPPPPPPDERNGLQRVFDESTAPVPDEEKAGAPRWTSELADLGQGAANGMGSLIAHPIKSVEAIGHAFAHPQETGEAAEKAFEEHPGYAIGQTLGGGIAGAGIGGVGERAISGISSGVKNLVDPVRAYRSPLIPENEAIARAATDIIKPNPLEYRGMVKNLTTRLPDAKEYLSKVGIDKVGSPLEFSKGAEGAGKKASGFYQNNLVKPNADVPVGSGTVSSNYARLQDINDKLRPIYRSRSMGEQMTKEASDHMAALEQERDLINGNLYKTLSDRSGIPEDQVRDINQRGAQLQHVGDITDASQATRRLGYGGFTPSGLPIPMGWADRAMKLVNSLRGGDEAVAGRKLQRVMQQVKEPPSSFPDPQAIEANRLRYAMNENNAATANQAASAARKPAGLGPTQPPSAEVIQPPPGYTERVLNNARQRSIPSPETPTVNPADRLLGRARELQDQARSLRRKQ